MELLYIWIEEYKNIKNQGFNFSPKYRFEYDKPTNQLKMTERDNAIDGFFGDKVSNVTAIVGENGAGKTTLLEVITQLLSEVRIKENKYHNNQNYIVIFLNEDDLLIYTKYEKLLNNPFKELLDLKKIKLIYHSNIYTRQGSKIETSKNVIDISTEKLALTNRGNDIYYDNLSLKVNYVTMQAKFLAKTKSQKISILERLPSYLMLSSFDWLRTSGIIKRIADITVATHLIDSISTDTNKLMYAYILKKIKKVMDVEDLEMSKESEIRTDLEIKEYLNTIKNSIDSSRETETNCFGEDEELYEFFKKSEEWTNDKNIFSISNESYYLNFENAEKYTELLEKLFNNDNDPEISICASNWVFDKTSKSSKLSTGEFFFLELFARLHAYSEKLNKEDGSIFFLFDEVDLGFHPAWQRRIINILINSLPKMFPNKNIQIVVTSHSPFIISDLPNVNTIFLNKDKETGYCIVKDSLKDMKQTFGANIHTLLSDSFFMESLMGEFAQEKIKTAIKHISQKNLAHKSEVESLIKMIGEPIIQQKMRQLFEEHYGVESSEEKIIRLEKELEEIKKKYNNE